MKTYCLCISIAISLAFLKKYYLVKKNYSEIFSNFDDLLQNFRGIPQSFANILPCFQFDCGIFCSQVDGIFRSQVVRKTLANLRAKILVNLRAKNPAINLREENPVYTFFAYFHIKFEYIQKNRLGFM